MPRRHGFRLLVVAVLTATTLAWLTPASRARLTAAATLAEALGIVSWRPFSPSVTVGTETIAGGPVDVYAGDGSGPVVVLVPGAVPAGRADERVEVLAGTLARSGRRVVVPELAVYDEQLVEDDVDRLTATALALSAGGRRVVFLGISFGGSLALLAAADPRLDDHVAGVATFGAYADLVGVLQAVTTGASLIDGQTVAWEADPRAEEVVRDQLTSLLPPASARAVRDALASGDTDRLPTPDAHAVYRLLANDQPQRTPTLARELPAEVRARLAAVSPHSVADRLADVPIVAMHARDDPVIPYGELLRLGAAVPQARLLTVEGLEHSELRVSAPGGWLSTLDDLRTMWSFTSRVLRWQEPTWPWGPS